MQVFKKLLQKQKSEKGCNAYFSETKKEKSFWILEKKRADQFYKHKKYILTNFT